MYVDVADADIDYDEIREVKKRSKKILSSSTKRDLLHNEDGPSSSFLGIKCLSDLDELMEE